MQEEFGQRKGEAAVLKVDLERAETTLQKANSLMSKMSGEKDRWEYQVDEIQRDAALLSTHTCLSAAYCTYLGHFSEDVRHQAALKRHHVCKMFVKEFVESIYIPFGRVQCTDMLSDFIADCVMVILPKKSNADLCIFKVH